MLSIWLQVLSSLVSSKMCGALWGAKYDQSRQVWTAGRSVQYLNFVLLWSHAAVTCRMCLEMCLVQGRPWKRRLDSLSDHSTLCFQSVSDEHGWSLNLHVQIKCSWALVSILTQVCMVFNAVLPEGSKVTHIQRQFSVLPLTCRDFSGLSESFDDVMDCRIWNI